MHSKYFKIKAHHNIPIQSGWKNQLIELLGHKPRRLSTWSELGLFGALSCLPRELSSEVDIRIYTKFGAITATQEALSQIGEHLPMPFTFMQTQPSQLFNALGTALNWHGDGCVSSSMTSKQNEVHQLQGLHNTSLLAWVDEIPHPISNYIWLQAITAEPTTHWEPISSLFQAHENAHWLRLDKNEVLYQGVEIEARPTSTNSN